MNWTIAIIAGLVFVTFIALKRMAFVSAELARKHLREGALVIDVRSPEEIRSGHVPEAVNIPLGELREGLPRHVKDQSQVLLLHCLSGGRSGISQPQAKRMGYPSVFNLGSYERAAHIVGASRST